MAIWGYFTPCLLLQYQNNVCSYHNTVCCYLVTSVLTVAVILRVQEPGYETGDVVIVLDEVDHRVFKRKGADLLMELVRTLHNLNRDYQCGSYESTPKLVLMPYLYCVGNLCWHIESPFRTKSMFTLMSQKSLSKRLTS